MQAEESERELRRALKPWLQVVQVKAVASKWKKFAHKRAAVPNASAAPDEDLSPASATQVDSDSIPPTTCLHDTFSFEQ
jgi:hypothetical protein